LLGPYIPISQDGYPRLPNYQSWVRTLTLIVTVTTCFQNTRLPQMKLASNLTLFNTVQYFFFSLYI
jgi:hypothetical protein